MDEIGGVEGLFNSQELEGCFRDAMARLWIESNKERDWYEISLALALERLVPSALVQVLYVYRPVTLEGRRDGSGAETEGAGEDPSGDLVVPKNLRAVEVSLGRARKLDCQEGGDLLRKLGEEHKSIRVDGCRLRIFRPASDRIYFSLSQEASTGASSATYSSVERSGGEDQIREEFGLFFSKLDPKNQEFVEWLINRVPEIRELSATLYALKRAGHVQRFRRMAEGLRARRGDQLSARLQEGTELIAEIRFHASRQPFIEYAANLEELGRWVVQELLGTEWSTRSGDAQVHRELPVKFFGDLSEVLALIYRQHGIDLEVTDRVQIDSDRSFESELRYFRNIADTWEKRRNAPAGAAAATAEVSLLRRPIGHLLLWSRWHEACFCLKEEINESEEVEQDWVKAIRDSLPMIGRLLQPGWHGKQARVRGLWPWLNLWLARQLMLEILQREPRWTNIPEDRWEFRLHLSLVLREGIRQSLFGDEPDFVFDSHRYLESLSHVVAHHAHQVVGIEPKFGLVRLLEQIGQGRHADDYPFAASHQQHALQVYIFGHFLLELTLEAESEDFERSGWKIKEALSAPGGSKEKPVADIRRLSQAFSLAAVHHDVGMLLFPRMFFPLADLADHGDRILASLRGVGSSILESGEAMLETCKRDLLGTRRGDGTWGEAAESLWDRDHGPAERDLLDRLMVETKEGREGQLETVAPDHSMLGGWYLYQLSAGMQTTDAEVVAQAVRAILFHQAFEYKISVARDPAAALLALCDEVFDWQPSTKRTSLLFAGAFRGGPVGLDVRPEGSRAKEIRLPGVEARLAEDDSPEGLRWVLRLTERESSEGWPRIELGLKDPDVLEVPAWQIWLQLAQNLSRLEPPKDDPKGFSPIVRITSKVPGRFRLHNRKSHNMLIGARGKLRQKFERELAIWLETNEWNLAPEADREALEIRSEGKVPFETNTKAAFDELSKAVDEYRRRLDNRQRN